MIIEFSPFYFLQCDSDSDGDKVRHHFCPLFCWVGKNAKGFVALIGDRFDLIYAQFALSALLTMIFFGSEIMESFMWKRLRNCKALISAFFLVFFFLLSKDTAIVFSSVNSCRKLGVQDDGFLLLDRNWP